MQETTAEQVVTAAEVVTSTAVESVDACEDRHQRVEAPVLETGSSDWPSSNLLPFRVGHQGGSSGQYLAADFRAVL